MKEDISVPRIWLESLLDLANKVEEANNNHENNQDIFNLSFKVAALVGYAKSAKSILEFNDKL